MADKKKFRLLWVVSYFVLLPLGYVLSIGPVVALMTDSQ